MTQPPHDGTRPREDGPGQDALPAQGAWPALPEIAAPQQMWNASPRQAQDGRAEDAVPQQDGQSPFVHPRFAQPQYGKPEYGLAQFGQPEYGQPQYGQPQYGQPQFGQPQYGQPQHGQAQYGHPEHSQPQHSQPQHGAPNYAPPQYGAPRQGLPPAQYGQNLAATAPTGASILGILSIVLAGLALVLLLVPGPAWIAAGAVALAGVIIGIFALRRSRMLGVIGIIASGIGVLLAAATLVVLLMFR